MTKYANDCAILMRGEMDDAIKNHGLFASPHEGLAIIMEEIEETRTDMKQVERAFEYFKHAVFRDCKTSDQIEYVREVHIYAHELMVEAMQVGAMALKYEQTFEREKHERT